MKDTFDPFNNRVCRKIRNELSASLMTTIQHKDMGPSFAVAKKYLSEGVDQYIKSYVNERITRYRTVVSQIQSANIPVHDTYVIALILWDQALFFEVHEWLEKTWRSSKGAEKRLLQALIRAAGTYMHLEFGRNAEAKKMASKAVDGLNRHKALVPMFFNIEVLSAKLKALDSVPPKLGAARFLAKKPLRNGLLPKRKSF